MKCFNICLLFCFISSCFFAVNKKQKGEEVQKPDKKESNLFNLNEDLNRLIGSVLSLTGDIYFGKDSIARHSKKYYSSIQSIKHNKVMIELLSPEEKSLYEETLRYLEFIEKEFNDYVKKMDENFTEDQYLNYVKQFRSSKNNALVKMDLVDESYRKVFNKTKYRLKEPPLE